MKQKISREIDRMPVCPNLTPEQIDIATRICFREDDPDQNVDCLFVFGTGKYVKEAVDKIKEILDKGLTHIVIITGGIPRYEDSRKDMEASEASLILESINRANYPLVNFILEETSTNSLENVTFGLEVARQNGLALTKIMFLFKAQVAGRGYYTLKKYLPNSEILQQTYTPQYSGTSQVRKDSWFETQEGRNRVWGEVLRLRHYGNQGHIDTSEIQADLSKLP